jgi:formaldehyde-activating enzyme
VAKGVAEAVAAGSVPRREVDELHLIAAVWVDWEAEDAALVYENNSVATRLALEAAVQQRPGVDDVLAARAAPQNPYFTPA